MRRTQLALLIASAMLLTHHAQALDLLQAFGEAQTFDSQFSSARAAREASAEKSVQGRAPLLPAVGLSGNVTKIDSSTRDYTSNNIQIQLKQPLYSPANLEAYEQTKLQVTASEIQFAQSHYGWRKRILMCLPRKMR